ncbi:hypothetical protein DL96DRAFT_1573541 [Flagelloscypha sp. PMI_526]|nr:hypothetical protein DL96DRAFT_1573541 [Flagelloscypha sp. PMI_526]
MSALQRSRTAPHPLNLKDAALLHLSRTASSSALQPPKKFTPHSPRHTVRTPGGSTPRRRETDPFNLSTFCPERTEEWSWLPTEDEEHSEEEEDAMALSQSESFANEDAEVTIAKEDKFGLLSLDTTRFFGDKGDTLMSPYAVDDSPVDDEALYQVMQRQRALKSPTHIITEDKTKNLFFQDDKAPTVDGWLGRIFA